MDGLSFRRVDGIWRFLPPGRVEHYEQFIREYEAVRRAEGRVSPEPAYYRALPFKDLTGRHSDNWRIRAKSFTTLLDRGVKPLEAERGRPLAVLDLGAGNCWLSNQLAKRGHRVWAVDLLTNDFDGLGCHGNYDPPFAAVQAEFEHLPFADEQFDLAIFNASLHYATDYAVTLSEALRVLRKNGFLAVVDSPIYRGGASGAQMVREREAQFVKEYGFASNSIPSENFLTYKRLAELEHALGLRWERIEPFYGLRWALRPWRARIRGHREPARFMVLLARRGGETGGRGDGERTTKQDTWTCPLAGPRDRQDDSLAGRGSLASLTHPDHPVHPVEASSPRPPVPPSPRLKVAFWRIVTRLRYRLLARRRFRKLALEEVAGRPFVVLPEVFNPKLFRTSEILVRALGEARLPADCSVLDMGTGSGVGAVFAAQSAGRVVAVDINPEAVRCARINALLNHVEDRVEVLRGDLFAPVAGQRFDAVLFNPPFYRGAPRDRLDMAWRSADAIERFAEGLPGHLAPGGWALVVLSTDGEEGAFLRAFQAAGLRTGVAARQDLGNEVVTVYRVRDQGPGARGLEGEAPAEPPVGMGIPTPPGSRAWMPDQVRHDIVAGAPWRSRVRHDGMGGEGFA